MVKKIDSAEKIGPRERIWVQRIKKTFTFAGVIA